jgi:autotransporter-associated beta strand protein
MEILGNETTASYSNNTLATQQPPAIAANDYVTFSVTIPENTVVDFSGLEYQWATQNAYRQSYGIYSDKTGFTYANILDGLHSSGGSGTSGSMTAFTSRSVALSAQSALQNLTNTTLEFRFYVTHPQSSSPLRAWAFDNISLSGDLHQDGTWTADANGIWTTDSNWSGTNRAYGKDKTANFTGDLTGDRTVTLGSNRRIGNIVFTDATSSNNLTISGNTLTLDVSSGAPVIDVTQADRTLTINSVVAGTNGLTKQAAGTLTLGGTNTYTGATTITGGTLVLASTGSIATSSTINVASGATLDVSAVSGWTVGSSQTLKGTGGVTGDATIAGTHAAGNSIGKQAFSSDLTYSSGSIFAWELTSSESGRGTNYDAVNVGGTLGGSGAVFKAVLTASESFAGSFWQQNRTWADIFKNSAESASLSMESIFSSFQYWEGNTDVTSGIKAYGSFSIDGSTLNWTAIPEPTTALAGLLLTAGLLRRRRNVGF